MLRACLFIQTIMKVTITTAKAPMTVSRPSWAFCGSSRESVTRRDADGEAEQRPRR